MTSRYMTINTIIAVRRKEMTKVKFTVYKRQGISRLYNYKHFFSKQ